VLVNAPERAVAQLKSASGFLVAFDALPGKFYRAKLRELAPAADPASRTYAARLTLLDAGDEVKLGMSATVRSELGAAKAIVIPNTALYTRDNATRVWLLDRASESVRAVEVKVGANTNEGVAIAEGLKAGDIVVTAGANLLQAGQKVRVVETQVAATEQPQPASPDANGVPNKNSDIPKNSINNTAAQSNEAVKKEAGK
jgi:membrane fusion protein, multidrug efflux system